MTITIERGVIPPFAAPAGIATVAEAVAIAVAVAVAEAVAEAEAIAEAIADGYIAEATA